MTELLEQALEAVRTKPPAAQDDIARGVLRLAARGELAADADVQAVWARHGL
jgi:hypothetical protein